MIDLKPYKEFLDLRRSQSTSKTYMACMNLWVDWLQDKEPTPENAQQYLDARAKVKSANTVFTEGNAIKAWFKLREVQVKLYTPGLNIPAPEYTTIEEVHKLMEACKHPVETLLITALFDTALRITELLTVNLSDIDMDSMIMKVIRKGGAEDYVNFSERTKLAIAKWQEITPFDGDHLFEGISYHTAWHYINNIGARVGIKDLHAHMFRHGRAVHALQGGAEMWVAQQMLGHKNINTTASVYGKLKVEHLKKEIPKW